MDTKIFEVAIMIPNFSRSHDHVRKVFQEGRSRFSRGDLAAIHFYRWSGFDTAGVILRFPLVAFRHHLLKWFLSSLHDIRIEVAKLWKLHPIEREGMREKFRYTSDIHFEIFEEMEGPLFPLKGSVISHASSATESGYHHEPCPGMV